MADFLPQSMQQWMRRVESDIARLNRRRRVPSWVTDESLDSGFVELPILDSNFEVYTNPDSIPRVRRIGRWVQLNGALRCITADYMVGATHPVLEIPLGFRPTPDAYNIVERRQASGTDAWGLQVNTGTGTTTAGRFNGASHGTNLWLPFTTTWITDDDWPAP